MVTPSAVHVVSDSGVVVVTTRTEFHHPARVDPATRARIVVSKVHRTASVCGSVAATRPRCAGRSRTARSKSRSRSVDARRE
jgi:acyl-CoA thioesterase FadM